MPIGAVRARGWTHEFLSRQRKGLTGHPEVSGYPYNTGMWVGRIFRPIGHWGETWFPYEQTAYYIEGAIRCAHLLNDDSLTAQVRANFTYAFDHPSVDETLRGDAPVNDWCRAVFGRALMAEYSVTADRKILDVLSRNYLTKPRLYSDTLKCSNIEVLCWLYGRTGNRAFLEMAEESYLKGSLAEHILNPAGHGVCYCEKAMLPAILYIYTGNQEYLDTAPDGLRSLEQKHVLVSGAPSSVEQLSGNAPDCAYEMCNVVALSWTYGYVLMATKEVEWADKIEKVVFNAGLGGITKDFKAHQYYSAVNQAMAAENNSHFNDRSQWGLSAHARMSYRTGHDTECCTGNLHRMFPNYVARMWMHDRESQGVAATLYGPSEVTFQVAGSSHNVTITETTDYPFSEEIVFSVRAKEPVTFSLGLRIPGWCKDASVTLNGTLQNAILKAGTFFSINRTFRDGDQVKLILPMELKLTRWNKDHSGVAIERGPLVYSLPVKARPCKYTYVACTVASDFPSYFLYPDSSWNYALKINELNLMKIAEVSKAEAIGYGWDLDGEPVSIRVPARRVNNWSMKKDEPTPLWPRTLELADEEETLTLVPFGCTLLRMTVFPAVE
ncbi:MAG: glycoside hydrolase family 127 protein [Planctomycetes bacterium]|nr:glycoside hydrolase family 127 protein [Planctomycetota bacterium]